MSSSFSSSDIKRVIWGATFKLAIARGLSAGIVFSIIFPFSGAASSIAEGLLGVLVIPIVWGTVGVPLAMLLHFIGMLLPVAGGWVQFCGALLVAVGDPLVYLLNRSKPHLLNIDNFSFFNLQPMIFILQPE